MSRIVAKAGLTADSGWQRFSRAKAKLMVLVGRLRRGQIDLPGEGML